MGACDRLLVLKVFRIQTYIAPFQLTITFLKHFEEQQHPSNSDRAIFILNTVFLDGEKEYYL